MTADARQTEIQQFLQYALSEWPAEAPRHAATLSARCRRCLVNDRYAHLEEGVCRLCREARPATSVGSDAAATAEVKATLMASVGRGRGAYDAVVLFSGGKDSTYLLHRLRTEHPQLRLLALMIDNGFASAVALATVTRVSAALGVDAQVLRPRPDLFRTAFRHALVQRHPEGCYATVDRMEGDLTFDLGRHCAADVGAPLLIAGLSREQVEGILGVHGWESPRAQECADRTHSAGVALSTLFAADDRRHRWWDGGQRPSAAVPRVLFPLHAWNPSETDIRSTIISAGLVAPGAENPLATNSALVPVMLALDSVRLGYSGFEPEFARMVRDGKAERAQWLPLFQALEHLARHGRFLPGCIQETLGQLGLTHQDLGLPAAAPDPAMTTAPGVRTAQAKA